MCSSPSVPAASTQVTPAAAPAPAAAAPTPTQIGSARQQQNIATGGNINGPSTRIDRTANGTSAGLGPAGPGAGLNM